MEGQRLAKRSSLGQRMQEEEVMEEVHDRSQAMMAHNNLLIQPWPSSCWPAHRMGVYPNSLINGLIHHTFKINLVFLGLDATFSC